MGDRIENPYELLEGILAGVAKPRDLPLALLEDITENFSEERKIGEGAYSTVYKGVFRNENVAVKKIFVNKYTVDEWLFRREVESLMMINNHPNLVRFLGFFSNTTRAVKEKTGSKETFYPQIIERLLCFEYIRNGSLDKHITDELRGLTWDTRFDIIRGICEGLRYLHEDKHIIHMDLKPTNILLDDHMVPKITNFGQSRFAENTRTQGERFFTPGYCAPEYRTCGQTSDRADIYSLGVVIVELVTGTKHNPDITHVLRRWRHRWNKPPTQVQHQQVMKCMEIAVCCREQEPRNRPSISDIIRDLSEIGSTNEPIGQTILYLYDDMLGIQPLELRFPLEHNKQTSCSVELTNETINSIAFNIRTPSKQYSTQPDKGIVLPGRKRNVKITLQPQESATQITNSDEFVMQSTQVNEGLADEDITDHMFKSKGGKKVVDEVNLMVVYEPEKYQVDLSPDRQDEEVSKEEINSMKSAKAPTVSYLTGSMDCLVHKLTKLNCSPTFGALHEDLVNLKKDFFDKLAGNGGVVVNLQVKVWIKQVRELVFDIEDWIDRKMETILLDPSEIENKIKEFRTLIEEARSRCKRYNLLIQAPTRGADVAGVAPSKVVSVDCPPLLWDKTYDLVGLDDPKEILKEHLLDQRKKLKVVSILGIGGLGKTTLAKELHGELQAEFLCGAFVYIGRNPSVRTILVNILHQTISSSEHKGYFKAPHNPDYDDFLPPREQEHEVILEKHLDEQQVIALLWGHLSKKRYFIVLDGIWSIRYWKAISGALPDNNLGSRILTTTRLMDVAESCSPRRTDVVHHMKALSEVESNRLFSGEEGRPADNEILKMCGGIPLAIILAARARKREELVRPKLHGKSFHSPLNQNSTSEGVTKILHMIYADLSLPVQSCFLYLSVFPEGYTIKKSRLILLWLAEGFIPEETRKNDGRKRDIEQLWRTGESYWNELISRRLIQPVFKHNDYEAVGCTIHAAILDFIRSLSREENFATMASELSSGSVLVNTIRRFSVDCSDEDEAGVVASSRVHLSSMRSLTVFKDVEGMFRVQSHSPTEILLSTSENLPPPTCPVNLVPASKLLRVLDLLPDFKLMRVLRLEDARNLENRHLSGIGSLVLLRYLGIGGMGIDQLPEEIGKLEKLETLDLRLKRLPASIVNLENLTHLQLDMYFTGKEMSEELQELDKVTNLLRYWNRLRMLGLTLDARYLTRTIPRSVSSFFDEVFRSDLQSLYLHFPFGPDELLPLLVDSWKKVTPPPDARFEPRRFELIISGIDLNGVPPNMAYLLHLTHLRIKLFSVDAEVLRILGGLPKLLSLNLSSACPPKQGGCIITEDVFQCLKAVFFKGHMGLVFQERSMPQLQMLSFHTGKRHFYVGIEQLTCLTRVHAVINCYGATDLEMETWEAHIREQVAWNPNKPALEFIRAYEDETSYEEGKHSQVIMSSPSSAGGFKSHSAAPALA